jgi:hypothetical protein
MNGTNQKGNKKIGKTPPLNSNIIFDRGKFLNDVESTGTESCNFSEDEFSFAVEIIGCFLKNFIYPVQITNVGVTNISRNINETRNNEKLNINLPAVENKILRGIKDNHRIVI